MKLNGRMNFDAYANDSVYFNIENPQPVNFVKFFVMENHGQGYTCLYRIRALADVKN